MSTWFGYHAKDEVRVGIADGSHAGLDLVVPPGADATPHLQMAASMVGEGGRVVLTPGIYELQTDCRPVFPSGVSWEGYGADRTHVFARRGIVCEPTGTGLTMQGLTFRSDFRRWWDVGLLNLSPLGLVSLTDPIVQDCDFTQAYFAGLRVVSCTRATIRRCRFQGNRNHGLLAFQCRQLTVRDCRLRECGSDGYQVDGDQGVLVESCWAVDVGVPTAVQLAAGIDSWTQASPTRITLDTALPSGAQVGDYVEVTVSGATGGGPGTANATHLALVVSLGSSPVLELYTASGPYPPTPYPPLDMTASAPAGGSADVRFWDNGGSNGIFSPSASAAASEALRRARIVGCHLENCMLAGIELAPESEGVVVDGCTVVDCGRDKGSGDAAGIIVNGSYNTVQGCHVEDSTEHGILLRSVSTAFVSKCQRNQVIGNVLVDHDGTRVAIRELNSGAPAVDPDENVVRANSGRNNATGVSLLGLNSVNAENRL